MLVSAGEAERCERAGKPHNTNLPVPCVPRHRGILLWVEYGLEYVLADGVEWLSAFGSRPFRNRPLRPSEVNRHTVGAVVGRLAPGSRDRCGS